jgi:type VI secretion system protein ImpG
MNEQFEGELEGLLRAAEGFARRHPSHASLIDNSRMEADPSAMRLLEGMAFISARLRHQIDNQLKDITEVLIDKIAPTYLRPKPSKTVIALESNGENNLKTRIKKRTRFLLVDENNDILFESCNEITVYPLSLKKTSIQKKDNNVGEIELLFVFNEQVEDKTIATLSLFIDASKKIRDEIFEALFVSPANAWVEIDEKQTYLEKDKISLSLIDETYLEPIDGLEAYFNQDPSLYLINVNLNGIDFSESRTFSVHFNTHGGVLPHQETVSIKPNCVLVSNEFSKCLEPVRVDGLQVQYELCLNTLDAEEVLCELHSIDSTRTRETKCVFKSFAGEKNKDKSIIYYRLIRANEWTKQNALVLTGEKATKKQVLSIRARVCQGDRARANIKKNQLFSIEGFDEKTVVGKNITKPSQFHAAIDSDSYCWEVLSLFENRIKALLNIGELKRRLLFFDRKKENTSKIKALKKIAVKTESHIIKGAWKEVLKIEIEMEMRPFQSSGDACLFSYVLHQYLLHHIPLNYFVVTEINVLEPARNIKWVGRQGRVNIC